jgi:predicted transcriptional regulator
MATEFERISDRDAAGEGPLDVAPTLLRRAWMDVVDTFPEAVDQLQAIKAAAEWVELRQLMTVGAARKSGKTWQQIADALGITRQAAQKRYGHLG